MRQVSLGAAMVLVGLSVTGRAAADARSIFVTGTSAGEPSSSKLATVYSLYALSGVGVIAGGYFTFRYVDKLDYRDDYLVQNPSPCADFASDACSEATRRDDAANDQLFFMRGSFAAAMVLSLGGLMAAHEWPNVEPRVFVDQSTAFANATFRF